MSTQWVYAGMGSVVGLDYCALEAVMRFQRVKDRRDCFHRIRIMEAEALKLIRERVKHDGSAA